MPAQEVVITPDTILTVRVEATEPPPPPSPADPSAIAQAYGALRSVMLEPLAIEALKLGTFNYVIPADQTRWVLNAWTCQINGGIRFDVRDPRYPVPLRGVSLQGTIPTSTAVTIDPTLPVYGDAHSEYMRRVVAISEMQTHYIGFGTGVTDRPFIPGPYGAIITGLSLHDAPWLIAMPQGPMGATGWNLSNEIGDAAADDQRVAHGMMIPVTKSVVSSLKRGTAGGPDIASGGLTYVQLPADWGAVPDARTYLFRDDFTTAPTTDRWVMGGVEHAPQFVASALRGVSAWGSTGMYSTQTFERVAGRTFECDVLMPASVPNALVGWHDGAGHSFTDMAHGVYFSNVSGVRRIQVFEGGTSRGTFAGYSPNTLYRVRVTLTDTGATYEIQGGPEYPIIGGATWSNITPATSVSSLTTLAVGACIYEAQTVYLSDPKVY